MAGEAVHGSDAFELILMRLERISGREDHYRRRAQKAESEAAGFLRDLGTAQEGNRRRDRDTAAAEAKICERAEYAGTLRSAINAIDPKALRRKRIVLPDMPKPFATEIPF